MFLNLLANAVDAMEEHGGLLLVQTQLAQDDEGRPVATAAVADAGAGIPASHLARIFEPFYTTKPEGHGTGLGLPVSLGIVRMHGGTLEAESKPGRGTTLRVRLPAA